VQTVDSRKLELARIPITLYKDDPDSQGVAEWHEVWLATTVNQEWVLCENHGWWDEAKKRSHFNVPILTEPFGTEGEANAAFDARIKTLDGEGWIHKLTSIIDYRIGRIVHTRIS
jgi:hypothetical protein